MVGVYAAVFALWRAYQERQQDAGSAEALLAATRGVLCAHYGRELSEGEIRAMLAEMVVAWALRARFGRCGREPAGGGPSMVELGQVIVPVAGDLHLVAAAELQELLAGYARVLAADAGSEPAAEQAAPNWAFLWDEP